MLPQQPDDDDGSEGAAAAGAFGSAGGGGGSAAARNAADNVSDNGSFHASAWEEERLKRSHVRWAGEQQQQQQPATRGTSREDQGPLRREPTPFPKEMRAMAKRMQNLRQTGKEAALAGSMVTSHGGSEYRQDGSLLTSIWQLWS